MGLNKKKKAMNRSQCLHKCCMFSEKKRLFKIFTENKSEYKHRFFKDKRLSVLTLQKSLSPQEWLKAADQEGGRRKEEGRRRKEGGGRRRASVYASSWGLACEPSGQPWCCRASISLLGRNPDKGVKKFYT